MRISVKGRYALAAMLVLRDKYESQEKVAVISIAEELGLSKIYLEQIFALLKKAELVVSVKGAQGGYYLSREAAKITIYDILSACETALFERTEESVRDFSPDIENTLRQEIFQPLDDMVSSFLLGITLEDLFHRQQEHKTKENIMYYI